MQYSADEIYTKPYEDTEEELMRVKWQSKKTPRYRLKTYDMGDLVEAEIYPKWDNETIRKIKSTYVRTKSEEREIYERRQRKYLRRLININFEKNDTWFTGTFENELLPKDVSDARRMTVNFIRRIKYKAKKEGLQPPKYIYSIEMINVDGEPIRCHIHMICNVKDRDLIENAWEYGDRPQTRKLKPDDFGLTGMAMYVIKASRYDVNNAKKSMKAYGYSTNLIKPETIASVADCKISKLKAKRMAMNRIYAEEIVKRLYPGMKILDISPYRNELIDGVYISIRLNKDSYTDFSKKKKKRN